MRKTPSITGVVGGKGGSRSAKSAAANALPGVTEEQFARQVIQLARLYGYMVAHFRPAMTVGGWRTAVQGDGKGFPDLVMARGGTLLVAELKVGKNKPTDEQEAWLAAFRLTGARVYEWRPEDWPEIERVLEEA